MAQHTITVIGNTNLDIMVSGVADLPAPGTERIVPGIDIRVGGSAGNLAIRCAGLGQPTTLISRVGRDESTVLVRSALEINHLESILVLDEELPSAVTVAVESPGIDRAFLSSLGAMAAAGLDDVPEAALSAEFVVLAGYFLLPGFRGKNLEALCDRARAAGARTVLDTGWPPQGWTEPVRAELLAALRTVDVFLPNDDELLGLTDAGSVREGALALSAETNTVIAVKLGSRGAALATPAGQWYEESTRPVRVVDSTGAGDGFNAALLVSVIRGSSWPEALRIAVAYATTLVSTPAAERPGVSLPEVTRA